MTLWCSGIASPNTRRSGGTYPSRKIFVRAETAYDEAARRKELMEGSPRSPENQERRGSLRPWPEVFAASRVTTLVATWFGTGFLPTAPGTWGSLIAIPVAHLVAFFWGAWGLGGFALGIAVIGVHAAGETTTPKSGPANSKNWRCGDSSPAGSATPRRLSSRGAPF